MFEWQDGHIQLPNFRGRISNGRALTMAISIVPTIQKTEPFKIRKFLSGFQMVYEKMAVICMDFKWLGFQISDPIGNPEHFQPNLL